MADCGTCKQSKPQEEFYFRKDKNSYRSECKTCHKKKGVDYNARNSDSIKIQRLDMLRKNPIYQVWAGMKARCLNSNDPSYKRYGGRGITVCERWMVYKNFENDMLYTYGKGLQIDRINNDGNYVPTNCKWSTPQEQSNNRSDNNPITFNGETMTIPRWAEKLGIKRSTLSQRIYSYKWSIEKALTYNI